MTTAPKSIALIEALEYIVEFEQRVQATARSDIAAAQAKLDESITNEEAWLSAIEVPACCEIAISRRSRAPRALKVYSTDDHAGTPRMVVTFHMIELPWDTRAKAGVCYIWIATPWPCDMRPELDLRASTFEALRGRVLLALAQLDLIPWQTESSAAIDPQNVS